MELQQYISNNVYVFGQREEDVLIVCGFGEYYPININLPMFFLCIWWNIHPVCSWWVSVYFLFPVNEICLLICIHIPWDRDAVTEHRTPHSSFVSSVLLKTVPKFLLTGVLGSWKNEMQLCVFQGSIDVESIKLRLKCVNGAWDSDAAAFTWNVLSFHCNLLLSNRPPNT